MYGINFIRLFFHPWKDAHESKWSLVSDKEPVCFWSIHGWVLRLIGSPPYFIIMGIDLMLHPLQAMYMYILMYIEVYSIRLIHLQVCTYSLAYECVCVHAHVFYIWRMFCEGACCTSTHLHHDLDLPLQCPRVEWLNTWMVTGAARMRKQMSRNQQIISVIGPKTRWGSTRQRRGLNGVTFSGAFPIEKRNTCYKNQQWRCRRTFAKTICKCLYWG